MQFGISRPSIAVQPRPDCVEKRNGTQQNFEIHKLLASIHRALDGKRTSEAWRIDLVASVVLRGLRTLRGPLVSLTTAEIGAATFLVLGIASLDDAARSYRAFGESRRRSAAAATALGGLSARIVARVAPQAPAVPTPYPEWGPR